MRNVCGEQQPERRRRLRQVGASGGTALLYDRCHADDR